MLVAVNLRRPAAFVLAALVAYALLRVFSGGGPGYIIQIDYTWGSTFLDGADVLIDGELAGNLEARNGARVNGFRVEKGDHVVVVQNEDCVGRPDTVTSGPSSRLVVLITDLDNRVYEGERQCVVLLR